MQSPTMKPVPSFEAQPEDFGPFTTVYTFNQVKDIRRIAIQETKKHCEERIEALVKEDGQAIATLQGIIREMDMRINYFAKSNQSLDEQVCSYRNQFAEQCEKSQELQLESNNLRSLLQLATDTYRKLGAENKKLNRQLKAQHKLSEQLERKICSFDEDFEKLCGRLETARSLALALDITVAQVAPEQQADEDVDVVPPSPPASPSSNTRAASPARVFEGESADAQEGVPVEDSARAAELHALSEENEQLRHDMIDLQFACQSARDERDVSRDEAYRLSGHIDVQDRIIHGLKLELSSAQINSMETFKGQAHACLELAQLREKYMALERDLRIAKSDCERLNDEKHQAIGKNKHLDAAIKKLKNCKQQVKDQVKEEMQKQFNEFLEQCTTVSEVISTTGLSLAEEAYKSQVKYYQDTTDLAQRHIKVIEELREVRAVLANGQPDVDEDLPLTLSLQEITLTKQLKRAVAENELIRDQIKTQHVFIYSTNCLESDKLRYYSHCVELEGKITELRHCVDARDKTMAQLTKAVKDKNDLVRQLHSIVDEGAKKLAATQNKLARAEHQLILLNQGVELVRPEIVLETITNPSTVAAALHDFV
jgi:hypothetical protein